MLNNVVTFLDEHALAEATAADAEIAAGYYRGPLHGLPSYKEEIVLGVAKIAQDAMGYHVMIPPRLEDAPLSQKEKEKLIAAEKVEQEKAQKAANAKQDSLGAKARL